MPGCESKYKMANGLQVVANAILVAIPLNIK
jgi:hypothetical protein